jgi:hypothetical protein
MLNKFRTWLADVIRPAAPVAPIVEPAPTAVPAPTVEVAQTVPVAPAAPVPAPAIEPEQITIKETQVTKAQAPRCRITVKNELVNAHEFAAIAGLSATTISNYSNVDFTRAGQLARNIFPETVKNVRSGNTHKYWRKIDAVRWSHFYWGNDLANVRVQKKSMYVDLKFVSDILGVSYQTAWQMYRQVNGGVREGYKIRLHRAMALRMILDYLEQKPAR